MTTTANISLKVPFSEKDQAKALGARWNAELKQWYVPQGIDSAPFAKWMIDAPASSSIQNSAPVASPSKQEKLADDDMDAINAKLREAFEDREFDY